MFLEKVLQMLIRMRDVVCFINRIFLNVSREEMNELIPDDRIEIILNNVYFRLIAVGKTDSAPHGDRLFFKVHITIHIQVQHFTPARTGKQHRIIIRLDHHLQRSLRQMLRFPFQAMHTMVSDDQTEESLDDETLTINA